MNLNYFFSLVIAFLLLVTWSLYNKVTIVNLEKDKLFVDNEIYEITQNALIESIEIQNDEINSIKVDYNKNLKEYSDYKKNPKIIELRSDDCKDIKDTLDIYRSIKF